MNAVADIELRYGLQRGEFSFDVDLELPLRGITGVFGQSGAGKTTLLRCIAGLEQPQIAKLVVAGDVWQDSAAGVRPAVHERDIGYVFQEPRLFGHLDVRGNIEYGRRRRGPDGAPDIDRVIDLLGIGGLLDRRPDQLSGGEAQRVAIARALLCAPRFVLMDEPLASLDAARKEEILPYLDRLHVDSDVPIVYVSHNIGEICRLCDHLVIVDNGRVVGNGELQSVLVRTDLPILTGEEAGSVIHGTVSDYDRDDGLTKLSYSGGDLWVPGEYGSTGTAVRLRVRANDISLCRNRPVQSSIINVVPCVIESIQEDAAPSVLARVALGQDRVLARVTRRSVRQLELKEGDELFAQIKSVAVRRS